MLRIIVPGSKVILHGETTTLIILRRKWKSFKRRLFYQGLVLIRLLRLSSYKTTSWNLRFGQIILVVLKTVEKLILISLI